MERGVFKKFELIFYKNENGEWYYATFKIMKDRPVEEQEKEVKYILSKNAEKNVIARLKDHEHSINNGDSRRTAMVFCKSDGTILDNVFVGFRHNIFHSRLYHKND